MSDPKYGISLLNDCKYGHDAKENTLRLTLLRSTHFPNPLEPERPNTRLIDQGEQTFCYALLPHSGDWSKGNTVRQALEFNHPIMVYPNIRVERIQSLVISTKPNVIVDSVKKAEDIPFLPLPEAVKGAVEQTGSSIIIRMHEAYGISTATVLQIGFDSTNAMECDLLENDQKHHKIVKSKLPLKFKPFEIKTIRLVLKAQKKKR
jgi:alpha-mannosidase